MTAASTNNVATPNSVVDGDRDCSDTEKYNNIVLGQTRCRDSAGYIATIVFDGLVENTSQSKSGNNNKKVRRYFGLEWDDPCRGKHNGSLVDSATGKLVQYFTTVHPTGGSFLLPHKVDLGQPLSEKVLYERYTRQPQPMEQHQVNCCSGNKSKPIEFVGHEKIVSQQQLETLDTVSLRLMGINSIPSSTHLSNLLSSCKHVDLAGNLLTDWNDLKRLLQAMPQLEHVSFANNRLLDATLLEEDDAHDDCNNGGSGPNVWSHSLKRLNLRKCHITTTRTLMFLGRALPELESLCCAFARLSDLEVAVDSTLKKEGNLPFCHVHALDVTSCALTTEQLPYLSTLFPALTDLNLTDNPVEKWLPNVFEQLTHLQWNLTDSTSSSPAQMKEALQPLVTHHYNSLKSLRLTREAAAVNTWKLQLVACLGSLEHWNASYISPHERCDAEKYYLRNLQSSGSDSNSSVTLLQTPRLRQLQELYPQVIANRAASLEADGSIRDNNTMSLVTVELRSLCAHSCERPPVIRKLPMRLTLGRLKALCSKHFDLDVDLQTLTWTATSAGAGDDAQQRRQASLPIPLEGDDSTTTLESCGLVNGAIVFMNEREIAKPQDKDNLLQQQLRQQELELEQFEQRKRALVCDVRRTNPNSSVHATQRKEQLQ